MQCTSPVARCLTAVGLNVVFFHIYQSQSTHNYITTWLSIRILRLKSALVKLVTQYTIVVTRIVQKLRLYIRFQFEVYRADVIGANLKVHEYPSINLL